MLPLPEPAVIFQKLGDGAVLFSPSTEIYFGLNEVGARVWELLPPVSASVDDICAALSREYPEVPIETIRTDVGELLENLRREKLVTLPEPGVDDAPAA
jgi:hypothetical protein